MNEYTFEVESVRRRKRNFHEMRVLELAVTGEVVNDGNFSGRFGFGFGPNFCSLWTGFSGSYSSSGTRIHRHFSSFQNLNCDEQSELVIGKKKN